MSFVNDEFSFPNTLTSASSSQQVLDPVNAEATLILAKCHQLIEDFRHKRRSKLATAIELARVIPESHLEASDGRRALDTYLASLDEDSVEAPHVGQDRPARAPRPTILANPGDVPAVPDPHQPPIVVDVEPARVQPGNDEGLGAFGLERVPDLEHVRADLPNDVEGHPFGRDRLPDIIARPLSRGSSVQPDEPAKRRRLDESALPWTTTRALDLPLQLSDLADKTRTSLAFFAKDIKVALASLLNSTSLVSFPESEWLALLKGQPVNLDKVAATFHNIAVDSHASHKFGDGFELRLGLAEPTKRIQSVEEWIYAWSETTKALVWVFPHRRAEAEAYQQYIVSHFKSTARRFHPRILLLDKRVRILVASRRDLTLASFHAFTEAERSFLSPIGADYSADSPSGSGPSKSRRNDEPCRRFNNGSCPSAANQCRYAHVCLTCKKPGHPASTCKAERR